MRRMFFLLVLLSAGVLSSNVRAQDVGLKTNVLYDAAATLNLGVEVGLAPRWTLDLSGNYNGWTFSGGEVQIDKEANRLQIMFDARPDKELETVQRLVQLH